MSNKEEDEEVVEPDFWLKKISLRESLTLWFTLSYILIYIFK